MADDDGTLPFEPAPAPEGTDERAEIEQRLSDAEHRFSRTPEPANLRERGYYVELLRAYRREMEDAHKRLSRRVTHLEEVVEGLPARFEAILRAHSEEEMGAFARMQEQIAGQSTSLTRLGNVVAMNNDHVQEMRMQHQGDSATNRQILAKLEVLDVIARALRIGGC